MRHLIREKIKEADSLKLNIHERKVPKGEFERRLQWNSVIDRLLIVLVLMRYSALYANDIRGLAYDKQRFFYYDTSCNRHTHGGKPYLLTKDEKTIILNILKAVNCSTYME